MFPTQQQSPTKTKKRTCSSARVDSHVKAESSLPQPIRTEGTIVYPRDARKAQIEEQVALHQSINKQPLTMRQIARRIQMSPGGHLMNILWEMAEEQRLIAHPRPYRETMTAWDFKLPPDRVGTVLERIYEVKR